MLNRLIKSRFPSGEKVGFVLRKTTLRVEAVAVSHASQTEKSGLKNLSHGFTEAKRWIRIR